MKRVVVGILFLFVGVFLVLHRLDFVSNTVFHWIISWQSLLVALGFVFLFDRKQSTKEFGAILMAVGLVFLLPKVFDLPSFRGFVLPSILIVIGFFFILKAGRKKKRNDSDDYIFMESNNGASEPYSFSNIENDNSNTYTDEKKNPSLIKREFVFSGSKEKWRYRDVKVIEIDAAFSGVELDLSQIEFDPNESVIKIKVSSVFSGVTLFIPSDWNTVLQKTGVFGGFEDRRPPHLKPDVNGQTIVLELDAVFGGGQVKYYE